MAVEKPALVNGRCEVLKGHCVKSNAGLYYRSYYEFAGCLDYLRNNPSLLRKMGINGRRYVEENYQWDIIIRQYRDAIESL
jgi:glycosyltransferase involved in cell wall biosynthesis